MQIMGKCTLNVYSKFRYAMKQMACHGSTVHI